MLRLRLFCFPATFRRPVHSHRNFVTSVLLTHTRDNINENVVDIRKEAKGRGLVSKGNKGVRHTSTSAESSIPGVTPGIPLSSQIQTSAAAEILPTRLPDLSQPKPETPIRIPYLPDFRNSSEPIQKVVPEETTPKILLVAGAATHPGGGPSHNLLDLDATSTEQEPMREAEKGALGQGGLWDDIAEDLRLPPPKEMKKAFWNVFS